MKEKGKTNRKGDKKYGKDVRELAGNCGKLLTGIKVIGIKGTEGGINGKD